MQVNDLMREAEVLPYSGRGASYQKLSYVEDSSRVACLDPQRQISASLSTRGFSEEGAGDR